MTDLDLDTMDAALLARLAPWVARAAAAVKAEVADAHAHAVKVLTDRLKDAPDGRPSARIVKSSRSCEAALGHLAALRARLVGPRADSLEGILRDAMVDFYRASIDLWRPFVPVEYRVTANPGPTIAGENLVRGAIIGGYGLFARVEPEIATAVRSLTAALSAASGRGVADRASHLLLKTWAGRTESRLAAKCQTILSDGQVAIHAATPWFLIAEKYHGERTLPAGGLQF